MVIRLPEKIWPTAFTIWHISKAVSPSGEVSSAPREFAVLVSLCLLLLLEGRGEKHWHRAPEDPIVVAAPRELWWAAAERGILPKGRRPSGCLHISGGLCCSSWPSSWEQLLHVPRLRFTLLCAPILPEPRRGEGLPPLASTGSFSHGLPKCDQNHLLPFREWMRTKVKLSWGYSFMTWTDTSPRPSTCRYGKRVRQAAREEGRLPASPGKKGFA